MSGVHLILLILGIVLIVVGALRCAFYRAWVDGIVIAAIGLVVLIVGGFVQV